jgi:thiol-disulfide isomerase/thioredoxin
MMMKKIFNIVIGIVSVIALVTACDIVEEPYLVKVDNGGIEPTDKVRKVLLEDFTGQKCPNCPEAAEIASSLKAVYGEQLVIVAVHAGHFAAPDATGSFTADFRTAEGTELNDFFGIAQFGYPMGMIDRALYNGYPVVIKDDWEAAVATQLEKDAVAAITITNTYNSGTRALDCKLESEFLEDKDGTYNICAYIIESNIISPQQTEGGVVVDYEHNHMLRGSMNGTWGVPVGTTGAGASGVVVTNNCSFTLPSGWDAANCAVVAYIYDTATNEVLQAEEKELVP